MNQNAINTRDSNEIVRAYFDSLLIEMRHLDAVRPDTSMTLYGRTFESPIMIAAFSHLDQYRFGGMVEIAKAAKAAGCVNWTGMCDTQELDEILATEAATVKIVKPYADEDMIYERLRHAEKAGALAVGMDIDHGFGKNGEFDKVLGIPMAPKTTAQMRDYVAATKLPFVVKGVHSVQDAVKCAQIGVKGIVVSHHHGIIPSAVPPLSMLPQIAAEVGRDIDVFLDCGIATGTDVFKALALGARAVNVGRAILPSLREGGAEGAEKFLRSMTAELRGIMARTCAKDIRAIDPSVIHRN